MKLFKPKVFFLTLIGAVTLAAITIYVNSNLYKTRASDIHATGTYTDWIWPSQNYINFQWQVTPNNEQEGPDAYFYSHQFGLVNGSGGYAGIQGDRNGKRAIFSIWDTLAAEGPEIAKPFGGEGIGYQTIINYPWVVGRTYTFRVERMEQSQDGTWWGAWVTDQTTGTKSFIGKIKAPAAWGALSGFSIVWIERYDGSNNSCSDIYYSSASFTNFTANNGGVAPTSHNNHLGQPIGCPGSLITDITGGVRHEIGVGNPVPDIIQAEAGSIYLSDLVWTYSTNGYGAIQKDKSASGGIITLNSQRYAKGLGVHANAEIHYNLSGRYTSFKTDVGIDEYQISVGSVIFQVWADGAKLFDSGTMTADSQTKSVNVNIADKQELKLIVSDGGDNINYDHADWANARLVLAKSVLPSLTPVPSVPLPSPTLILSPSLTPPATPTPSIILNPTDTKIKVSIKLAGIGTGGNTVPKHLTRKTAIGIFDLNNKPLLAGNGHLKYNGKDAFEGIIHVGQLANGVYYVKVTAENTLIGLVIPEFQALSNENVNILPTVTLTPGDLNNDNVIDITDFNLALPCYQDKRCQTADMIDFNDDGVTNVIDYNIFLASFKRLQGD